LLSQFGKGGATAARGRRRVAALRPRRLAVLLFRGFPALLCHADSPSPSQ
jgi:hypothetical protein